MPSTAARSAVVVGALVLVLPACRQDEITAYRVPKETAAVPMASASGGLPPGGVPPGAAPAHRDADWTVPSGWQEMPLAPMRVGSFRATARNGKTVEISVVPLAGEVGGELANVNRWRGQLSLPPVGEADLAKLGVTRGLGPHQARVFEFANETGNGLLAAVIHHAGMSWFFKATGDAAALKEVKAAFFQFVSSVRFHDHG
jgi:hypothetical protein